MSIDETVRLEILKALTKSLPHASNLRVGVISGIAHLGGNLSNRDEWGLAEAVAHSVFGVRGVVNRIEAPDAPAPGRKIDLDFLKSDEP
jgi:osmotically-inducible protein OsmY